MINVNNLTMHQKRLHPPLYLAEIQFLCFSVSPSACPSDVGCRKMARKLLKNAGNPFFRPLFSILSYASETSSTYIWVLFFPWSMSIHVIVRPSLVVFGWQKWHFYYFKKFLHFFFLLYASLHLYQRQCNTMHLAGWNCLFWQFFLDANGRPDPLIEMLGRI